MRAGNAHLAALVRDCPERLFGLAVVNPLHPSAPDDSIGSGRRAARAETRAKRLVPVRRLCARLYARAAQLRLPILFHSGIFIDGRSGRFCRPVFYEAIRDHPGLRVTLAHLGWPWCDEANAVGLIDRINGVPPAQSQFRFDLSFGPPPVYRLEVIRRALAVLGPELLQFGSDRFLPCSGEHIRSAREELDSLLDTLQVSGEARAQIMSGTAAAWLNLKG